MIELATSAKEMATTNGREKDPWLAQLDWTLENLRGDVVSSAFFVAIFFFSRT
jgi:hypothetical protein